MGSTHSCWALSLAQRAVVGYDWGRCGLRRGRCHGWRLFARDDVRRPVWWWLRFGLWRAIVLVYANCNHYLFTFYTAVFQFIFIQLYPKDLIPSHLVTSWVRYPRGTFILGAIAAQASITISGSFLIHVVFLDFRNFFYYETIWDSPKTYYLFNFAEGRFPFQLEK